MRQFLRDASRATTVAIASGILAIIALIVVGLVGVYGFGWFTDATANRQGETSKQQKIEGNGQYRIAAYDHFYDACASVQAAEASIHNLGEELKTVTDPQRKIVLQASITALRNSRAEKIADYNVDARKTGTLGQFKASDLPFKLDPNEENTSCTVS